jgi:acyl dehydratase
MPPEVGDTFTHTRTFSEEAVRQFGDITGDDQPRHTEPDENGLLMVQGLLTGSLVTKIGGDIEFLAQKIAFEYHRPVYTGDTIRCVWTNDTVTEREHGWEVTGSAEFRRISDETAETTAGELVARASVEGRMQD